MFDRWFSGQTSKLRQAHNVVRIHVELLHEEGDHQLPTVGADPGEELQHAGIAWAALERQL